MPVHLFLDKGKIVYYHVIKVFFFILIFASGGKCMSEPESIADKLEELAKKVERATFLIENLREENRKLKTMFAEKVKEGVALPAKSGAVAELEQRLATLTKHNQDLEEFLRDNETWIKRKDDIKKRLESILERVAKLEEPHEDIFVEEEEGEL